MNYRRLGNSGLWMSEIGLGSYLTYGQRLDFQRSKECIQKAIDVGINFFDTADSYGKGDAERCLGGALRGLKRSRFVVGSKCYYPISESPNDRGLSRKHIVESVEQSLKNLQMDHLDLFQCHRFDTEAPLEETVRAISDLIGQGKVLYWGVSRWSTQQVEEALHMAKVTGGYPPVSHQSPYNLLYREAEVEVFPGCQRLGLGALVYYPLSQGILTGKYSNGKIPEGSRAADSKARETMCDLKPEVISKVVELTPIAEALGMTLAQLSIAWCLRQPAVACALMGATTLSQIEENVEASGLRLPQEILVKMDEAIGHQRVAKTGLACGSN